MADSKHHLVIVQHNDLTKARYKLSLYAQRLIWALTSKFHPQNDDIFHRHTFQISDLYKLLKMDHFNPNLKRKNLLKTLKELQTNLIEIPSLNNSETLLITSWIEAPEINFKTDLLTLRGAEHMRPFFLHLYKNYHCCLYSEIARLTGAHSFRFLIFCRDYQPRSNFYDEIIKDRYVKKEIFELDELRQILQIPTKIYPKISNFKKRVLEASQKEVNTKTSAYFEFEMIKDPKDGRKTKAVKLLIFGELVSPPANNENQPPSLPEPDDQQKALQKRLTELGVSPTSQNFFLKLYQPQKIKNALTVIEEYQQNKKIKYPTGALNTALKEGWMSKSQFLKEKEDQNTADRIAAINTSKALTKGVEEYQVGLEKQILNGHENRLLAYENRLNQERSEYAIVTDKMTYIISVLPADDYARLNSENQKSLKLILWEKIDAGEDFDELKELAIRSLLGFLLPLE